MKLRTLAVAVMTVLAYSLPTYAQADGPIANPGEMAFTHELAVGVLNSIPAYKAEFKQVFGKDSATIDMVTDAIAAFEETLVTPDSRFDKWLKGDKKALTAQELDD